MSDTSDSGTRNRMRRLSGLANPTRFLALVDRVLPWFAGASVVVLAIGLWFGYMRYRANSLWLTIVLHALNNLTAVVLTMWLGA